jgi:hypothetical protein
MSARSARVRDFALALPPFFPPALPLTCAGLRFASLMVSSASPIAISNTCLASSLGSLGRLATKRVCHRPRYRSSLSDFKLRHYPGTVPQVALVFAAKLRQPTPTRPPGYRPKNRAGTLRFRSGQALGHRTVESIDSPSYIDMRRSPFHPRAGSAVIPNRQSCRYGYRAAGKGCRLAPA